MSKNLINYRDSSNNTTISVGIRFEASYAERKESYAKTSVMYANHYAYMLFTCWALYNTRSLSHFTSYTYISQQTWLHQEIISLMGANPLPSASPKRNTHLLIPTSLSIPKHYYRWWMCLVLPATRILWHVESSRIP